MHAIQAVQNSTTPSTVTLYNNRSREWNVNKTSIRLEQLQLIIFVFVLNTCTYACLGRLLYLHSYIIKAKLIQKVATFNHTLYPFICNQLSRHYNLFIPLKSVQQISLQVRSQLNHPSHWFFLNSDGQYPVKVM